MKVMEALGYAVAAYGVYFAVKCVRILRADCDLPTMRAKLPKDAYKGKVCWVTGASSGIGKAIAYQLVEQGATVIISARNVQKLNEAKADMVAKFGCPEGSVHVLPADLGALDSLPAVAEKALAAYGRLDVLVNNAGVTAFILGKDMSMEVLQNLMTTNFLGQVCITQKCLPALVKSKGTILNMVSRTGVISGLPYRTAYCASKHAMVGYFGALRSEHMEEIKVTNIYPGLVATNFCEASVTSDGDSFASKNKSGAKLFDLDKSTLTPERVADRSLAAAYNNIWDVWIWSNVLECLCFYFNQYSPEISKSTLIDGATKLRDNMGKEIEKSTKGH